MKLLLYSHSKEGLLLARLENGSFNLGFTSYVFRPLPISLNFFNPQLAFL